MTQKDKELLLRDLSARLPYGIKVHIKGEYHKHHEVEEIDISDECVRYFENWHLYEEKITNCRLYLRPMSSMTEKEKIEISKILNYEFYLNCDGGLTAEDDRHSISMMIMDNYINFLLSHHFDFRRIWDGYEEKSMIEKGLALPAPDGMYNIKEE